MKKFAKMSLVAATVVAGLSTTASAKALEDAIKNVDVSGKVYFEALSNSSKTGTAAQTNAATTSDIDFDITFKSKVNDNVTAVVRFQADKEDSEESTDATKASNNFGDQSVTMDNLYFVYANSGLTVQAGKQDMNTPNTDGEHGNGVLALYNMNGFTFAGAHFYDHELAKASTGLATALTREEISVAAVLGSIGPVNAELWYVNFAGDHVTAVVGGEIAGLNLKARYATSDLDAETVNDDRNTLRFDASYSIAGFGLSAAYVTTDKDGGAVVTDASSANTYELSQLGFKYGTTDGGKTITDKDVDVWALGASYTMDAMKYQVDYASYEQKVANAADTDADELRFRATYTMSKNFKLMATYSMYEVDRDGTAADYENDSARLEAKYTF